MLGGIWHDLRWLRILRVNPAFSLTVILLLALA